MSEPSQNPDVIFISYQEPEADKHYARLLSMAPGAKRVHGVKGIYQAMQKAGEIAESSHLYIVDGDNWVLDGFSFGWPETTMSGDIYCWPAINAVNQLRWFNGALKLVSRAAILSMEKNAIDFFGSMKGQRKSFTEPAVETRFNATPLLAWRCGFRECAKMTGGVIEHPKLRELLEIWQTAGAEARHGDWCILGSRMGAAFGKENFRGRGLAKLNDAEWLRAKFEEVSRSLPKSKGGRSPSPSAAVGAETTQQKLARAMAVHQQGDLAQAEKLYQEVLAREGRNSAALHLLGVAKFQSGNPAKGLEFIDKSLAVQPNFAEARCNRGNVLKELGRLDEALASYERAIALKPDFVEAHYNRGIVLQALGRPDASVASYDRAIALRPSYVEAHFNRGAALSELGRLGDALASYDRVVALRPNFAQAHNNRGNVLKDLERLDEALASCDRAIALKSDYPEAYSNRGNVLMALGRLDEALASYDRAIALNPNLADVHDNRGNVLKRLERFDEALASYAEAIALSPDSKAAHDHRSNLLKDLRRFEDALASWDAAIAAKPDFVEAHINRGLVLQELTRLDDALASYDRAIALKPDRADAYWNKSWCLLMAGLFDEGWRLFESCKQNPALPDKTLFVTRSYPEPEWLGDADIADKTLFVYWEQGLGDTIQFCRYLPLAERLGARVVLSAQNGLHRLLRSLSPTIEIIDEAQTPDRFDYHCPLMSLPAAFKTTVENAPAQTPYLRGEPERVENWRRRIGEEGFKIGVSWQGRKRRIDIGRSFAVAELAGLSQIPNVRLISLQKSDGAEQLRSLPAGMEVESLGEDYDAGADAFLDAAAVMQCLDLVITSDTALAHLAGALGRPVWVALKQAPDWRWLLHREDTPWYPTMRLFRQKTRDDWSAVFPAMQSEVSRLAQAAPAPEALASGDSSAPIAPISWGELVDKITILEIKSVKIADPIALANVRRELSLLSEIAATQAECATLAQLRQGLREVNGELWEIEDRIRQKERAGAFDDDFIALARSVYKRNDERAALKRQVNELLMSDLVEEKSFL